MHKAARLCVKYCLNLQNIFSGSFIREHGIRHLLLMIPPHVIHVAALPCETSLFYELTDSMW